MRIRLSAFCFLLSCLAGLPAAGIEPDLSPGGANAPEPVPPPALVIGCREFPLGEGAVRIPQGDYTAPDGGAPNYAVPAPIVAVRAPGEEVWRGHGYLETWSRLTAFSGGMQQDEEGIWTATLVYTFEGGLTYEVELGVRVADGHHWLSIAEKSTLGPRDRWVFDCYYAWQPTAAFAVDASAAHHAFRYLPCHFDRPEASILHRALAGPEPDPKAPVGVAVLSADPQAAAVLGLWARELDAWEDGDRLPVQLWQRRQLGGDPASRHFLGPETKSDGTPNPATAEMIGTSRYEGHVTIECAIGAGSRRLGLAVFARPEERAELPAAFGRFVREGE